MILILRGKDRKVFGMLKKFLILCKNKFFQSMRKFKFNSLADGFSALFAAFGGEKVILEIPENSAFMKENLIVPLFVENNFSLKKQSSVFSFSSLEKAAAELHEISPNTFYEEKVYAFTEKSGALKNFSDKIFKKTVVLDEKFNGLDVKTAPAYRCNYSRLVISVVKTLEDFGSEYVFVSGGENIKTTPYKYCFYKTPKPLLPEKYKAAYFPCGIFLFSRCGEYFIVTENAVDAESELKKYCPAVSLQAAEKIAETFFSEDDLPLQAFLAAKKQTKNLKNLKNLRLSGSKFDFSPSMPDVIGYADSQFDLIKRDGVNVDVFKNAVFDFGTHIEDIISAAYDLRSCFPDMKTAFEAAIGQYRKNELKKN